MSQRGVRIPDGTESIVLTGDSLGTDFIRALRASSVKSIKLASSITGENATTLLRICGTNPSITSLDVSTSPNFPGGSVNATIKAVFNTKPLFVFRRTVKVTGVYGRNITSIPINPRTEIISVHGQVKQQIQIPVHVKKINYYSSSSLAMLKPLHSSPNLVLTNLALRGLTSQQAMEFYNQILDRPQSQIVVQTQYLSRIRRFLRFTFPSSASASTVRRRITGFTVIHNSKEKTWPLRVAT